MAVRNTYVMVLARSLDVMLCSWIWRDYDITISSMCGLTLAARAAGKPYSAVLATLGDSLNRLQDGHCAKAIVDDTARANKALDVLAGRVAP